MFYVLFLLTLLFRLGQHASISDSSCKLPAYPANGQYSWNNQTAGAEPGPLTEVSAGTILQYSCNAGYTLTDETAVCQGNDIWTSAPRCANNCTLYGSYTVDYECFSPQRVRTPCERSLPHNSSVVFECKAGHSVSGTQILGEMSCLFGTWSLSIPECEPDCGLDVADGATFIYNAPVAKKDTLPWHVAIYEDQLDTPGNPNFDFICGGTILSTRLVVGAAHCFYDPINERTLPAQQFRVAANKHYRAWDHPEEANSPKSEVREIRLNEWYRGEKQLHQKDIAILVLTSPFEFTDKVRSICYDVNSQNFDNYQLSSESVGKFAGWGETETKQLAEELRILSVPFIDHRKCVDEYKRYNTDKFLTEDKICAGYLNGSTGCLGDSGGGLVFPDQQKGQQRWWLRGILSLGPRDGFSCRHNTYTAFTRLFALSKWLKRQINDLSSQREIYRVQFHPPRGMDSQVLCLVAFGPNPDPRKLSVFNRGVFSLVHECGTPGHHQQVPSVSTTLQAAYSYIRVGCPLPAFPTHGKYMIPGQSRRKILPGEIVEPSTYLKYSCDANYRVTMILVECQENNTWSNSPVCESDGSTVSKGDSGGVVVWPDKESSVIQAWGEPDSPNQQREHSFTTPRIPDNVLIGQSKCVLPAYPTNGRYTIGGDDMVKNLSPGAIVTEYTAIMYSCNKDYELSTKKKYSMCEQGSWNTVPPVCIKKCKMMRSLTVDFSCTNKRNKNIPCSRFLRPGVKVNATCKPWHNEPSEGLDVLTCGNDGNWDNPRPECIQECGLEKSVEANPIVNRTTAPKGTYTWHVGIFKLVDKESTLLCGGTLIYSNIVITAAHCLRDYDTGSTINAENVRIAAGKFLRFWDRDLDENKKIIQKSEVAKIYVHEAYREVAQSQQYDLALLKLTTPFNLSESVLPICLALRDTSFNIYQTRSGTTGKLAGWGELASGEHSEKLKDMEVEVISIAECSKNVNPGSSNGITADKFCAGYANNGFIPCRGDSGGGLVFSQKEDNFTRWYLQGVASGSLTRGHSYGCLTDPYSTFTSIFRHRDWLAEKIKRILHDDLIG